MIKPIDDFSVEELKAIVSLLIELEQMEEFENIDRQLKIVELIRKQIVVMDNKEATDSHDPSAIDDAEELEMEEDDIEE